MKRFIPAVFALTLILGLSVSIGLAQEDVSASVTIEVTGDSLTVPEEITGGMANLTFDNQSSGYLISIVGRLKPDATPEQVQQATREGGFTAVVPLLTLLGGPVVEPQSTGEATYNFETGTHAMAALGEGQP